MVPELSRQLFKFKDSLQLICVGKAVRQFNQVLLWWSKGASEKSNFNRCFAHTVLDNRRISSKILLAGLFDPIVAGTFKTHESKMQVHLESTELFPLILAMSCMSSVEMTVTHWFISQWGETKVNAVSVCLQLQVGQINHCRHHCHGLAQMRLYVHFIQMCTLDTHNSTVHI